MKKLFLVVLYGMKVENSKTCQFINTSDILKRNTNTIYIWDNSPSNINSEESVKLFFSNENVIYKHTPENMPLSKIYNLMLRKFSDYDAIQFFDQDSYILKENYDEYITTILQDNLSISVFFPKIYSNGCLYSPGKLIFFKGFHYKYLTIGINKKQNYTAIGSGILFRPSFCKEYNIFISEKLKLYSVDTDFVYKISRKTNKFYVMDVVFEHDLSETSLDVLGAKKRRKEQLEGLLIIYEKEKIKYLLTLIYTKVLQLFKMV